MTSSQRESHRSAAWAIVFGTFVFLATAGASVQSAADTKSPASVKALVDVMSDAQLTAIAARHPTEPGRYVAAMLFPGVQLLVISARSDATDYIEAKLTEKAYADVYRALHQGIPESKVFIQDMGGDGFRGAEGGLADIVYEKGKDQHVLNGDHKSAKMSESDYARLVQRTDSQYAEFLALLQKAAHQR